MAREAETGAIALAQGSLAACQGVDLVLAGIGGLFVGIAVAQKLGLPLLQAYYIPFTPTRGFPSFAASAAPFPLPGALNRLSHTATRQMMWQAFRRADGIARREVLGLPSAPFCGPYDAECLRGMPVLCGYSPSVIAPPPDWGPDVHVTGYWFLDPPAGWSPPEALVEFLQAGPVPVFVGFGSMSSRKPEETTALILQALAQAGQRAVILPGWGGMSTTDLPETVIAVESVPFSWLFPRVAAVVHHGGAGTTSIGLRAGVPSVVVPFFGDQPYWGRLLADHGVGPSPIPRKKLTAERLAQAIRVAVTDPGMRRRATDMGAAIRAEDGVGRAVEVVGRIQSHRDGVRA
jgi:UDP:flavonoid glycosyltransferase YjiC (YdhE family)